MFQNILPAKHNSAWKCLVILSIGLAVLMLSITGCASNGDVEHLEGQVTQLEGQVTQLQREIVELRDELRAQIRWAEAAHWAFQQHENQHRRGYSR